MKIGICREAGEQGCLVCRKDNWTNGMKKLRSMGFSAYPKTHEAFRGWFCYGMLQHSGIEVRHDRATGKWEVLFDISFGKGDFEVSDTMKSTACGVSEIVDDYKKFMRRFSARNEDRLKILCNIFRKGGNNEEE